MINFIEILKKYISIPLYKNAYFLIASTVITSIFGFAFWMVVARFYTTEALGLGSAIISALALIAVFADLGLGIGLIRFLPGANDKGNDMLNTCFTLSGLASLVASLVFLAGLGFWSPALLPVQQNSIFLLFFVIFAIVWAIISLMGSVFLAKRFTKFILIQDSTVSFLKLILIIPFAILFKNAFGIVGSAAVATCIALLMAIFWLLPKIQPGYLPIPMVRKNVLKEIGHYSIGNYVGRIFLTAPPLVFPLMVINVLGAEMNAYFYVAWLIVMTLCVIPSSVFNSLFAEASTDEKSLPINIARSLKHNFLLLLPAIIVILIIGDKLLLFFGSAYSQNGALLLRIMAFSIIFWSINYFYVTLERIKKKIGNILVVSTAATFLSLGLSYFLMLKMGLVGAGIGYLTGQGIVAIIVTFHLLRRHIIQLRLNQIKTG